MDKVFDWDAHIVGMPAYLEPADDPEPPIGLMVWWSEDEDEVPEIGEVIRPAIAGCYHVQFPKMGDRILDPSEWQMVSEG